MSALFLTVILSAIVACIAWLLLGNRFALAEPGENSLVNLLAYGAIGAPFVAVFVYFVVERL